MTAGADASVKHAFDDAEVFVHSLCAGKPHLVVYVIIRAGDENAGLLQAEGFYKFEILFVRTYPACDLREFIAEGHTLLDGAAVFFGINEKFALTHKPLRSAELVEQPEQVNDLSDSKGRGGLLSVAECGVGYPDLLRHIDRHVAVIERDLRHRFVVEQVAVEVRCFSVLKLIFISRLLKQICCG